MSSRNRRGTSQKNGENDLKIPIFRSTAISLIDARLLFKNAPSDLSSTSNFYPSKTFCRFVVSELIADSH